MPKPRQRICLNQGLKLDLNKLRRQGLVRPDERSGPHGIRWNSDYWGEIASAFITANKECCMKVGFAFSLGISISGSHLFPDLGISADTNGTLFVRR